MEVLAMTAVIYARYSSDNQREESIEGQIRECTAYAEKNDITIVKHYIDRAISAKTDNRPQFQQMIKDSDKKLFDIVLVWKLDRFARNRYDSARYKTQLKRNGVKLMSATEIISEGPEGIILESVLEGYAEYYSADLAEKVVRGQTENILKGRCNGGRGTFGYTLDSERKFHIDPLASPFVLESFTKYRDGLTMKEIRDWLNENGIKNPVGGEFTYNSVEHMLKNRRYIGELKFRDVVVPNAIPPIIPLELFEDVQEKMSTAQKMTWLWMCPLSICVVSTYGYLPCRTSSASCRPISWACSGVVSPGAKDCIRWWARLLPFCMACDSSSSNSMSAVS